MNLIKRLFILMLLLPAIAIIKAVAEPQVHAELTANLDQVAPGSNFYVLFAQNISPGWHTYWRNPGDSGAATELHWVLPEGVTAGQMEWPFPERVAYGPLMNFGYHDQVVYPIPFHVAASFQEETLSLKVKGEWLVCQKICIPEQAELRLSIPVGEQNIVNQLGQQRLQAAQQKVPKLIGVGVSSQVFSDDLTLMIDMAHLDPTKIEQISYFPFQDGLIDNPAAQHIEITAESLKLTTKVGYDYQPGADFSGVIVIAENSGEKLVTGFEISPNHLVNLSAHSLSEGLGEAPEISLLGALLFAFLGGILLNLMPCVFPVLSIKILSLIQATAHVKSHGWVYLFGVVLSFMSIAVLLLALRAGGEQVGWGFQLQSPIVVGGLAYLFLLVGLNLSGYFEFGNRFMGVGQNLTAKAGHIGSFFTGVLATVVAAPCTAPFMASAIGFALTQTNLAALLVFACLGLGMAAPYLLLCYSSRLLGKLPRPGIWMEKVKELLAFPLYISAVWLVWVLSLQTGAQGALVVGIGMVALSLAIWLLKNLPAKFTLRLWPQLLAFSLIGTSLIALTTLTTAKSRLVDATASIEHATEVMHIAQGGLSAEPYSVQQLDKLLQAGPVFVNFTAAWCITCKVNEAVALNRVRTMVAFKAKGVAYLRGDWTTEDPAITQKLAEFGRSGVPLYLLYTDLHKPPMVLPQLLTEDIILQALQTL